MTDMADVPELGADLYEVVDSLKNGDRVRVTLGNSRYNWVAEGPLYTYDGIPRILQIGEAVTVRDGFGKPGEYVIDVQIMERAPKPFYTNTDRQPQDGDVARTSSHRWHVNMSGKWFVVAAAPSVVIEPGDLEFLAGNEARP